MAGGYMADAIGINTVNVLPEFCRTGLSGVWLLVM
jgi:hypothetical protein